MSVQLRKGYTLTIGGVRMVIAPRRESTFSSANPFYKEFFEEGNGADKPGDINVEIAFGKVPDTHGMLTLLEGDESWSMFRSGSDYVMRFDRKDSGKSYMVARFDPAAGW